MCHTRPSLMCTLITTLALFHHSIPFTAGCGHNKTFCNCQNEPLLCRTFAHVISSTSFTFLLSCLPFTPNDWWFIKINLRLITMSSKPLLTQGWIRISFYGLPLNSLCLPLCQHLLYSIVLISLQVCPP